MMTKHLLFLQISAKNKGIQWYGDTVSLSVTTREKGKDNASVMCLIYMYICIYVPVLEIVH